MRLDQNQPNFQEEQKESYKRFSLLATNQFNRTSQKIEIWRWGDKVFGIVAEGIQKWIISGERIVNPLQSNDKPSDLILKLGVTGLKRWDLVYDKGQIYLWPCIKAAANEDDFHVPTFPAGDSQLRHIFRAKKGHLPSDSHENRQRLIEVVKPEHFRGINTEGKEVYLKTNRDGSQTWVEVREGVIQNGGIQLLGNHRRFCSNDMRMVDYWLSYKKDRGFCDPTEGRVDYTAKKNPQETGAAYKGRAAVAASRQKASDIAGRAHNLAVRRFGWGGSGPAGGGGSGGGRPPGFWSQRGVGPGFASFSQKLQQTGLVRSYNGMHQSRHMPEKGMTQGDIGGVAAGVSYIENLFDDPEDMFIDHHYYAFPTSDGTPPFTEDELSQILRELAKAIYVDDAAPFFSLHFQNEGTDLFPVVHPAYANTLVGRVIGMLDYIMKGYLNGGVYDETFIDEWHKNPDWSRKQDSALQSLIEFSEYCKDKMEGSDQAYLPLKLLMGDSNLEDGFRSAFRIIAKVVRIEKCGPLLNIETDFDVFYDINPTEAYSQKIESYTRKYGRAPTTHTQMEHFYKQMAERIHDHMQKMPLGKKYFSMLSVIGFFSSYFFTLKKHGKEPCLPIKKVIESEGCPALFPHLPITDLMKLDLNFKEVIQKTYAEIEPILIFILRDSLGKEEFIMLPESKEEISEVFSKYVADLIEAKLSPLEKRFLQKRGIEQIAPAFVDFICRGFKEIIQAACSEIQKVRPAEGAGWISRGVNEVLIWRYKYILSDKWPKITKEFLKFIEENFLPKINKFFSEKSPITIFPNEQVTQSRLHHGRYVGGCGLKMERKKVETSAESAAIWRTHLTTFSELASEKWAMVSSEGETKAVFGLSFVDRSQEDDSWMEHLLESKTSDLSDAEKDLFVVLERAISDGDIDTFKTHLETIPSRILPQQDHGDKTLLQYALLYSERFLNNLFTLPDEDIEIFETHLENIPSKLLLQQDRSGKTLLHYALLRGERAFIEGLLQKEPNLIDVRDKEGNLPLHYAAMSGSEELLQLLYKKEHRSCVNQRNETPFTVAIIHGNLAGVTFFLAKKARFSTVIGGYTDLHIAIHQGDRRIIDLLLQQGRDVPNFLRVNSIEGGTPLMLACELGDVDLVQKLVAIEDTVAVKRQDEVTAIEIAVRQKCLPLLRFLLSKASPSALALKAALQVGSEEIVNLLSNDLFEWKNSSKDTALHYALLFRNVSCVLALIKRCPIDRLDWLRAKNREGMTVFQLAVVFGDWDVVKALIEQRYSLQREEYLALAKAGYTPAVKSLMETVSKPNQLLIADMTLLAAQVGNYQMITNVLKPMGAKLEECEGPQGWQLVHYLAKSDGIFLFRFLLHGKPDITKRTDDGWTLIGIAARYGSKRVFQYLVDRGAPFEKVNGERHLLAVAIEGGLGETILDQSYGEVLDPQGRKAPHIAAKYGCVEVLKKLALLGANMDESDEENFYPLDYAIKAGCSETIDWLVQEAKVRVRGNTIYLAACQPSSIYRKLLQNISADDHHAMETAQQLAITHDNIMASKILGVGSLEKLHATFKSFLQGEQVSVKDLFTSEFFQLGALKRGSFETLLLSILRRSRRWRPNQLNSSGTPPLFLAITHGFWLLADFLIEEGANINFVDDHLMSPLGLACIQGSLGLVRKFLQLGADPNQKITLHRKTLLGIAAATKNILIIQALLEGGARLDSSVNSEDYLLHALAVAGENRLIHLFIRQGADLLQKNKQGIDPKGCAIVGGHLETFQLLLSLQSFPPSKKEIEEMVELAMRAGQTKICAWLLDQGAAPKEAEADTPSLYARAVIGVNPLGILPLYESYRISDEPREWHRAIAIALTQDQVDVLRYLYAKGPNINAFLLKGYNGLHIASQYGALASTRWLLHRGVVVDIPSPTGETALELSARNSSWKQFQLLFSALGNDVNQKYLRGETLLHITAKAGNLHHAAYLISERALLDLKDSQGCTALYRAAQAGQKEMIRLLLGAGADPTIASSTGESALEAFSYSSTEIKDLIRFAIAHRTSLMEETIMHRMVRFDCIFGIKVLMSFFAREDWAVKNKEGLTPFELAQSTGKEELVEFLGLYGG